MRPCRAFQTPVLPSPRSPCWDPSPLPPLLEGPDPKSCPQPPSQQPHPPPQKAGSGLLGLPPEPVTKPSNQMFSTEDKQGFNSSGVCIKYGFQGSLLETIKRLSSP